MIFDAEGDSLYPSKFHVISYNDNGEIKSLTSYDEMREWLLKQPLLIGHNILLWDIPHLERVLEIKITARIIDTLALSWYIFPKRKIYGLEAFGEYYNIPKPPITDWENLSLEEYVHRCETDVRINTELWKDIINRFSVLYDIEEEKVINLPIVHYLMFKMDCALEQENSKWRLDKDYCEKSLFKLQNIKEEKETVLSQVMPHITKQVLRPPPAKPYKKDGTLSVTGCKWKKYLDERGLTWPHLVPIYVDGLIEPPNPSSPVQVKDWLFSLGWEPSTFKEVKDEWGNIKKIPQVKLQNSPDLCPSVLALIEQEPAIEELQGLSVVNHRIGILTGFLKNVGEDGKLKARVQGFTNTLRFKHTEIVNLPGVDKLYGEEMRGSLICDEGNLLVGSDMRALEDLTKRHYMYPYDPEYVKEMSTPGYDPHLDLAVRAKAITEEDLQFYKECDNTKEGLGDNALTQFKTLKKLRHLYKTTNYGATYGIREAKLSRDLRVAEKTAKALLDAYWERNWAIKKVAEDCVVKEIGDQKWLYNPVSKFWYSLRYEKDRFSTLNQGTGVYCFDLWIREFRKERKQLTAQFHDEVILEIREKQLKLAKKMLNKAIDKVNDILKLNIKLEIDIKSGKRYSDIH